MSSLLTISLFVAIMTNFGFAQQRSMSTHVLDTDYGGNAINMECRLYKLQEGGNFVHLSTQWTNQNGRITEFLPLEDFIPGTYRIWFGTKEYYNNRNVSTFFPGLQTTFEIADTVLEHHIPLILSPFGFTTHRGS